MFIVLVTTGLFRMFIQGSSFAACVCVMRAAAVHVRILPQYASNYATEMPILVTVVPTTAILQHGVFFFFFFEML